jgi:cell division protein FtsN
MAAKDSENRQWTDPKDFGLPYVEIKPLNFKAEETKTKSSTPAVPEIKKEQKLKIDPISTKEKESVQAEKINEVSKPESATPKPIKEKKSTSLPQNPTPKKSNTWGWAVIFLAMAVVSVIVWQLMGADQTEEPKSDQPVADNTPPATSPEVLTPTEEITLSGESQNTANEDSIATINNSNPNISKPTESGTTIANSVPGTIVRIESKAERPQYFIVVGSLPNENLALDEAKNYQGKAAEIFLIAPYEESRNYRLAVGKYNSFKSAAEDLERIKSNYSESLWILKY